MDTNWLISLGPVFAPWVTFAAVVMALYGIYLMRSSRKVDVYRRLRGISNSIPSSEIKAKSRQEDGFQVRWLQPAGELILPPDEWRRSAITSRLIMAGYRSPGAVYVFLGAKLFASLLLTILVFVGYVVSGNLYQILTVPALALIAIGAIVGFFLPDLELSQITKRRQRDFEDGFPDALDMLVVCVEAGLGLDAAIDRVAREIHLSHPELAIELGLISLETRAGKSRKDALQGLADRTNVDQVQSLATLLIQAERFGTSVASALRDYSLEMRTERLQRAKEKAAKLPVKLIFPVVLFIFPALFLVIMGPAVIQIVAALGDVF
ncbi:MAG: type II secretion system F family protein [Gammaproteobacteria bacterium]|nr:type II secretion system F family protein [Gammaproteobacteria bacterium]